MGSLKLLAAKIVMNEADKRPEHPGRPAAARAVRSLRMLLRRLRAIRRAGKPKVEAVHQIRVQSRRGRAALQMLRPFLGKRRFSAADRSLKRLLDAAGAIRNCDIAIQRLLESSTTEAGSDAFVRIADSFRAQRTVDANAFAKLVGKRKFANRIRRCVRRLETRKVARSLEADYERNASSQIRAGAALLLDKLAAATVGAAGPMHRVRIAAKKLRYLCEFVDALPGSNDRIAVVAVLKAAQDALGNANDLSTFADAMKERANDAAAIAAHADVCQRLACQQSAVMHMSFEAKQREPLTQTARSLTEVPSQRPLLEAPRPAC